MIYAKKHYLCRQKFANLVLIWHKKMYLRKS